MKFPSFETCQVAFDAFKSSKPSEQILKGRRLTIESATDPKNKGRRKTKGPSLNPYASSETQSVKAKTKTSQAHSVDLRRVCVTLNDMQWPEGGETEKERTKIYKKIKKVSCVCFHNVFIFMFFLCFHNVFFMFLFKLFVSVYVIEIET